MTDELQAPKPFFTYVDTDKVEFDPENPRLGGSAEGKTQDEIQEILEKGPHYAIELVGSIVQNGFVPYEPLVVRQHNETYRVIEGNRRLAAVRYILRNKDNKFKQDLIQTLRQVPVLVFHEYDPESQEKEIKTYLGIKHMFGFRDWPALSKAIYLDKRILSKEDLDIVSLELEMSKDDIAGFLIPYRLRKAAKKIFQLVEPDHFWSLAESFGRPGIRNYIKLKYDRSTLTVTHYDNNKLRFLAEFLYGEKLEEGAQPKSYKGKRRIRDTREISKLGKVLTHPQAALKLEQGSSLDDALGYAEPRDQHISKLLRNIEGAFKRFLALRPTKTELTQLSRLLAEIQERVNSRL